MSYDLVSIGMPVYNGEAYLAEAIKSNLEQTHENLELIIADNASTDNTESICREYQARDNRIRYTRNAVNIGAAGNYNRLFELSNGNFFRWANADDVADPTLVEKLLPTLQQRDDVAIAFGRTQLIDANGKPLEEVEDDNEIDDDRPSSRYQRFYLRLGLTNIIYGLMRSSAMANTTLMGDGKLPAGDISFLASMILQGKFVGSPETLFYRRIHDAAFSSNPDPVAEAQFWQASGKAARLQNWRAFLADFRMIIRASLPFSERSRTMQYWAQRMFWERRLLLNDLRDLAVSGRT